MPSYVGVVLLAALGLAFTIGSLGGAWLIRPSRPVGRKLDPYESGMRPVGDARGRHVVRFYLVAMLFVVFDVELVFLYPWAVHYARQGEFSDRLFLFGEMAVFVGILLVAYVYAYKRGVFDWNRRD